MASTPPRDEASNNQPCEDCVRFDGEIAKPCCSCNVFNGIEPNLVFHGDRIESCDCEFCVSRREWFDILKMGDDHGMMSLCRKVKYCEEVVADADASYKQIIEKDLPKMAECLDEAIAENAENARIRLEQERDRAASVSPPPIRRARLE